MMVYPNALQKGDKIALVAPSSRVASNDRADYAVEYFRRLGLVPVEGRSLRSSYGYLAGTDAVRADDINWAFGDDTIKGVFCVRGGNGVVKILDRIDYDLIRAKPKFFSGYSDVSLLHCAIGARTGLVTYHTPMATEPNFEQACEYTLGQFERYIFDPRAAGDFVFPQGSKPEFLVDGRAEGILVGGNLAALAAAMGTVFEIDTRDKIFLIEEVGERPPKFDRRMAAFRMSGKLAHCAGIIFGQFTNCASDDPANDLDIPTVIRDLGIKVPTMWGFPCGHSLPTASLPLGAWVRMDSAAASAFCVVGDFGGRVC